jgi:carbamoyl-phosphate synthase large subunit
MKALRSLERKEAIFTFPATVTVQERELLLEAMKMPTEYRLQQVQKAMWAGASNEDVYSSTKIDRWFLKQLEMINDQARDIRDAVELDQATLL